jgi:hypothetical protein
MLVPTKEKDQRTIEGLYILINTLIYKCMYVSLCISYMLVFGKEKDQRTIEGLYILINALKNISICVNVSIYISYM